MTAGNQGSVRGRNLNSQTANEELINKSLFSHSSLNHIYMPMEQEHAGPEGRAVKGLGLECARGWVWGVPGGRGASPSGCQPQEPSCSSSMHTDASC